MATNPKQTIVVNGTTRYYDQYISPSFKDGNALLVGYCGLGQIGSDFNKISGYSDLGNTEGLITVFPDPLYAGKGWSDADDRNNDMAFIEAMIYLISTQHKIKNIFVIGASNGGMMAYRTALELGTIIDIKAFSAVAGFIPFYGHGRPTNPNCIPLLAIHGTDDKTVTFAKGQEAAKDWETCGKCINPPKVISISPSVQREVWRGCTGKGKVEFYTVTGGMHEPKEYFGSTGIVDATSLSWAFFKQFNH